jgi:hypothetical protein
MTATLNLWVNSRLLTQGIFVATGYDCRCTLRRDRGTAITMSEAEQRGLSRHVARVGNRLSTQMSRHVARLLF